VKGDLARPIGGNPRRKAGDRRFSSRQDFSAFRYNAGHMGSPVPPADDPWVGRLLDEYKILQDKLDKIGEFRFTIKGWSVTVTLAALAAATAANAASVALLPLLLAMAFFMLERKQHELSEAYARRAVEIEAAMMRLRSGRGRDLSSIRFIPGIGNSLWRVALRKRRFVSWRKVVKDADYAIYLIQALVIICVAGWIQFVRVPAQSPNSAPNTIAAPAAARPAAPAVEPSGGSR